MHRAFSFRVGAPAGKLGRRRDHLTLELAPGSTFTFTMPVSISELAVGVEALRADKQALMFLTKEAIHVATAGFAKTVGVPGPPSIADLHDEYVANGGRFYACPVCVKVRNMQDANWGDKAEVASMPSVYEYTAGGALVFNY